MKVETFEQRIKRLEGLAHLHTPGTAIQRALVDVAVLVREGLDSRQKVIKVCANSNCLKPWKGNTRQCLCAFQGMALWKEVAEDGGPLRHSEPVWSVGLGELQGPKIIAYGHTISEALDNIEAKLSKGKCCERDHNNDGNCDRHPARRSAT